MTDNENLIRFVKPPQLITLTYDPNIQLDLSQADNLVSYDIDAMPIEQLREWYRCLVISLHEESIAHIRTKGRLRQALEGASHEK